jgi:2-dehydro-3-deoxyphosphogluconate aldolase / (4S)-4-hydroxy-2-oxoglutarate aldolase
MNAIDQLFISQRIVPVVTLATVDDAVPMAEALLSGGLSIIEVTLRTTAALGGIESIRKALPAMKVGAGTLTLPMHFQQCKDAGAEFLVSPGGSALLADAADATQLPWLPGVMTPSEIIQLLPRGQTRFKLFPAVQAGGIPMLKTLASVFPELRFCPTGGIAQETAGEYLALSNVMAVGGSWMVPAGLVDGRDWEGVGALARKAATLMRPVHRTVP